MDSQGEQIETRPDKSSPSLPSAWSRAFVPSVADLIFIVLLVAMTMGSLGPRLLGDASIGWHIRNGELMLRSHSITRSDPFSATMSGQAWYAWEWLYDVAIARIHAWSGLNGVVFLTALIVAATFGLALRVSLRRGADLPATVILLALSLGASMIHLLARPHVLSWFLSVVWFQLLDSSESSAGPQRSRRLWWLPLSTLLWVNVHGGFVVGFVLLGIYLASAASECFRSRSEERGHSAARLRSLGQITAASLLASLVNPFGYRLHVHVYQYLANRWLMNHIDEFRSPDFHGIAQQCFVLILLIAIVALAIGKKPSLAQVLVLLFAAYSGLYASRSLPVSSLLITLVVAPLLTPTIATNGRKTTVVSSLNRFLASWRSFGSRMGGLELSLRGHLWPLVAGIAGLFVCAHQGMLGSHRSMNAHFDETRFPVQAGEEIVRQNIHEPILAPDLWGGYLIYRLYPQPKVFVDDRHDFYGEGFLKDYLKAIRVAPDWDIFLNEKRVNWALVPEGSSLAHMLEQTRSWAVSYRDGTAVLFRRTTPL